MALFPCGKGVLIHLLVDADGIPLAVCSAPANEDERRYVDKLIETVSVKTRKAGRPSKNVRRLAVE